MALITSLISTLNARIQEVQLPKVRTNAGGWPLTRTRLAKYGAPRFETATVNWISASRAGADRRLAQTGSLSWLTPARASVRWLSSVVALALGAAERLWGATDSRLVPIIYSLIKHHHLQAVAVEQGGKTGWELRQIVPGADLVRERDDMRRYFYVTGLGLLDQLRSIQLAQAPFDLEGAAMANLYTCLLYTSPSPRDS